MKETMKETMNLLYDKEEVVTKLMISMGISVQDRDKVEDMFYDFDLIAATEMSKLQEEFVLKNMKKKIVILDFISLYDDLTPSIYLIDSNDIDVVLQLEGKISRIFLENDNGRCPGDIFEELLYELGVEFAELSCDIPFYELNNHADDFIFKHGITVAC